jgi:hypothetical protein
VEGNYSRGRSTSKGGIQRSTHAAWLLLGYHPRRDPARGMKRVIAPNPTHKVKDRLDQKLYALRYRIECGFHGLTRFRRTSTTSGSASGWQGGRGARVSFGVG